MINHGVSGTPVITFWFSSLFQVCTCTSFMQPARPAGVSSFPDSFLGLASSWVYTVVYACVNCCSIKLSHETVPYFPLVLRFQRVEKMALKERRRRRKKETRGRRGEMHESVKRELDISFHYLVSAIGQRLLFSFISCVLDPNIISRNKVLFFPSR